MGSRTRSGTGKYSHGMLTPALAISDATQASHRAGANTNDTAAIAAVAPMAIASDRHSRRPTNHSSPTPGVTFVSRMNAHAAGQRKPATIARAISVSMLPRRTSRPTNPVSSATGSQDPRHRDECRAVQRVPDREERGKGQGEERAEDLQEHRRVVVGNRGAEHGTGVRVAAGGLPVGASVVGLACGRLAGREPRANEDRREHDQAGQEKPMANRPDALRGHGGNLPSAADRNEPIRRYPRAPHRPDG